MGVVWSTENFKIYLYGIEIEIVTDRRGLLLALKANQSNKTMHSKLTCWVNQRLPFNFKIQRIPGKETGFTDLMSRLPSGKALPTSHYDNELVVATVRKNLKQLILNGEF